MFDDRGKKKGHKDFLPSFLPWYKVRVLLQKGHKDFLPSFFHGLKLGFFFKSEKKH
jgi:hypothetical protein